MLLISPIGKNIVHSTYIIYRIHRFPNRPSCVHIIHVKCKGIYIHTIWYLLKEKLPAMPVLWVLLSTSMSRFAELYLVILEPVWDDKTILIICIVRACELALPYHTAMAYPLPFRDTGQGRDGAMQMECQWTLITTNELSTITAGIAEIRMPEGWLVLTNFHIRLRGKPNTHSHTHKGQIHRSHPHHLVVGF